jgi:hypothetical protein
MAIVRADEFQFYFLLLSTLPPKNWTWKDGWEHFKKIVSRPEKVASIKDGLLKLNTKLTVTESMFVKDIKQNVTVLYIVC